MMINRLITLNQTIIQGYNSVSWIPYTLTGSGFIGLVFDRFGLALPSGGVMFALSVGAYYFIGHTHNVHAKEVMK
jgi:hypothetical protein